MALAVEPDPEKVSRTTEHQTVGEGLFKPSTITKHNKHKNWDGHILTLIVRFCLHLVDAFYLARREF